MFPKAKKTYGQHFLTDTTVIDKILAAAKLKPGEVVLEIGPGTGVLTQPLLKTGARVVAVEADTDLLPVLKKIPGLDLISGDILSLRRADRTLGGRLQAGKYQLIANIPYYITSNILEEFLSRPPQPQRLILMVQKEVADRILAKPSRMGLLSVVCQLYAQVNRVASVPRGAFRPMPKVDSAVIQFDIHDSVAVRPVEDIIALAKAGFSSPRRQLHRNLAQAGHGSSENIKQALTSLALRPDARAEMLSTRDWTNLAQLLQKSAKKQDTKNV